MAAIRAIGLAKTIGVQSGADVSRLVVDGSRTACGVRSSQLRVAEAA